MEPTDGPTALDHAFVVRFVVALDRCLVEAEEHLTDLDAAIGDADHGANMTRGLRAAVTTLVDAPDEGAAAAFVQVGGAMIRAIGGASGPLYGTLFVALGRALPPDPDADGRALAVGLREALYATQRLGAAIVGDKTMVDALAPAVAELEQQLERGRSVRAALEAAMHAAERGARATTPLRARRGRASYLGVRSEGHQDPGATSSVLVFDALRTAATTPRAPDVMSHR